MSDDEAKMYFEPHEEARVIVDGSKDYDTAKEHYNSVITERLSGDKREFCFKALDEIKRLEESGYKPGKNYNPDDDL